MGERGQLDDWQVQDIADGGSRSARGLLFQYLVTLSTLVGALERGDNSVEAHVERLGNATDAESIDIAVMSSSSEIPIRVAQVKSVTDTQKGRPVGPGAILDVLLRLVRSSDSDRYEYVTNARLTSEAMELTTKLESGTATRDVLDRLGPLSGDLLARLERSRIVAVSDGLSFRRELNDRIVRLRRKFRTGVGSDSSFLLCGYLLSQIHAAAAGYRSSVVSARDVQAWLRTDSAVLTNALGQADWGLMIGVGWPEPPAVTRAEPLSRMENILLAGERAGRISRVLVEGPSGIGKSALIATYAYGHKEIYDLLAWVPCGSAGAAQAAARELMQSVAPDLADRGIDEASSRLRMHLQTTEDHWLIVLDDVVKPDDIPVWVPTSGNGTVIVTSRNGVQLREWPSVRVDSTSRAESVAILAAHMGGSELEASGRFAAEDLCRHLGDWPLALAMAGSFLASAGDDLVDSTARYRRLLSEQVIHDHSALPRTVPIPLAQSILLSLKETEVRASKEGGNGGASLSAKALRIACYLADAPIPVALLLHAATVMAEHEIAHPDEELQGIPNIAPEVRELMIRELVRGLRWRCLAEFVSASESGGPYIRVNSVVKQVVRNGLTELESSSVLDVLIPVLEWQLRTLLDLDRGDRAIRLADHGSSLAHHALRASYRRPECLTLLGNAALAYRHDGQWAVAADCLRLEKEHLEMWWEGDESPSPDLFAKILTQLATVVFEGQMDEDDLGGLLVEAAGWVLRVDPSRDAASLRTATGCASTLIQLMDASSNGLQSREIRLARRDLLSLLKDRDVPADVRAAGVYGQAQELIRQDRDAEAMSLLAEHIGHCATTEMWAGYIGLMAEIRVHARDLTNARLLLGQLEPLQNGVVAHRRALATALSGSIFAGWKLAGSDSWVKFLTYAVAQLEPLSSDCRRDQHRDLLIAVAWLARVADDEAARAQAMADYDEIPRDYRSDAHDVLVAVLGLRRPFES